MLKVPTVRKTYVTLKHFEYTYAHLELLKNIQQLAPNLPLEVVPPDQHVHLKQFIAAFNLDLDDLKLIRRLNP